MCAGPLNTSMLEALFRSAAHSPEMQQMRAQQLRAEAPDSVVLYSRNARACALLRCCISGDARPVPAGVHQGETS